MVAWYQFVGNQVHLLARTSTHGGRSWGPRQSLGPALVAPAGDRPAEVRAAVGANGEAAVAFQAVNQRVLVALAQRGGRFGRNRVLSPRGVHALYPDVAIDGRGRVAVVWVTPTQVQRALVLPGGRVTAPRVVATGTIPDEPAIAAGRGGDLVFGWIESITIGPSAGDLVVKVARERANGARSAPQRLEHPSNGQLPLAQVAIGPAGRATVVWEETDGETGVIWAASAPRGRRFGGGQRLSPTGPLAILGGGGSGSRGLGVDNAGRVSAVWVEIPPPGSTGVSRVRVATSSPAGGFAAGRTLQTVRGTNSYERPAIGVAPLGGTIAAWTEQTKGGAGPNFVWAAGARGPSWAFSRPTLLPRSSSDDSSVAGTSAAGAGIAVWSVGTTTASVQASRWTP